VRVLPENLGSAQDGLPALRPPRGGFFLDLLDKLGDRTLLLRSREVLPAGQGREDDSLLGREAETLEIFVSPARASI
jgi:hypothetical protein